MLLGSFEEQEQQQARGDDSGERRRLFFVDFVFLAFLKGHLNNIGLFFLLFLKQNQGEVRLCC